MKCQSTVHNKTDEVVYVIVSSRIIGVTTTAIKGVKTLFPTPAAITKVGLESEKQVKNGPTPVTIVHITPGLNHTFNLDSSSYYLTYCTKTETGVAFHLVNERVKGKNDYVITPNDLQQQFNIELAKEIMDMIEELSIKKGNVPMN